MIIVVSSFAQVYKPALRKHNEKQSLLVVHFTANDFTTATYLHDHPLGETMSHWTKLKDMSFGLGLQYLQNWKERISFSGRMDGSFARNYFQSRLPNDLNKILIEADAGFNFKLLPDKHSLIPYLHTGVGGSVYGNYFGGYLPLGAGLQLKVGKGDAFIVSNAQYRLHVTNKAANHFNFSIGVGGLLTKGKPAQVVHQNKIDVNANIDTDGDGIYDYVDSCKIIPGSAKYKGCPVPDSDYDGINDNNDHCPHLPGVLKYNGCPIPDTDGDGINDESDSCVTQPGTLAHKGCPVPDSDHDGVNDEMDECPDVPGSIANHGCPEKIKVIQRMIDTLAHQIFFATGSAVLLSRSYLPLQELITLLKENSSLGLMVEGHTDNTASDAINMVLSHQRAESVVKYFVQHGIDRKRLQAKGFGSSVPVANNNSAEGKALNRRVEMKIRNL